MVRGKPRLCKVARSAAFTTSDFLRPGGKESLADWSSAGPFVRPEELLMLPPKVAASRVVFQDVALRRNLGEAMAKPSPS